MFLVFNFYGCEINVKLFNINSITIIFAFQIHGEATNTYNH